jgi:hypothetical protein
MISFVCITIFILKSAILKHYVITPFCFGNGAIGIYHFALSVLFVQFPSSLVGFAVRVHHDARTRFLIIQKVTVEDVAIFISNLGCFANLKAFSGLDLFVAH